MLILRTVFKLSLCSPPTLHSCQKPGRCNVPNRHRHKTEQKTSQSLLVTTATALARVHRYRHTDTRHSTSPSQGPQIQTQTQDTAENTSVLTGDNSNSPSQRPQIQTHRHKTQWKTPQSLPVTTATALASIRRYRHTDTRQSRKHLSPYW